MMTLKAMLILLLMIGAPAAYASVTIDNGMETLSQAGGGIITAPVTLTVTEASIGSSFYILRAPAAGHTWVGFDAPAGCNVAIMGISKTSISYDVTAVGLKTTRVYIPGKSEPNVTGGVGSYNSDTGVLSVLTNGNAQVVLTWVYTEGTNNSALLIASFIPLMLVFAALAGARGEYALAKILLAVMVIAVLLALGSAFSNIA